MICWMTAFIDMPVESFEQGTEFWRRVTGAALSPRRGDDLEFVTLLPPDGDAFLRAQRVVEGSGGIHLDLHVEPMPAFVARANHLGARAERARGYVSMQSPGGFRFCAVANRGETVRPGPLRTISGASSLVDQISLDIPHDAFDDETKFWADLTGWELRRSNLPEFASLVRPAGMPLRLLFQRLGRDDPAQAVRAHIDLACGGDVERVAEAHVEDGAVVDRVETYWTTMIDPAGFEYCLTRRDPATGLLD